MRLATLLYSGGKDSHYTLYYAIKKGYKIPFLINLKPIPASKGKYYFNHPYCQKIIEIHSSLMRIPVLYYRFDIDKYELFKNKIEIFMKEVYEFARKKAGFDIKFFFTWDNDDIKAEKKHIEQYNRITSFLTKEKIDFEFPFLKKNMDYIIKNWILNL
ncbi:MAG: hypothetical protein K6357_02835 [Elusimicrobiota bacterium]